MSTVLTIYSILHVICGVLAYGFCLAYLQKEYPRQAKEGYEQDITEALISLVLGVAGLVYVLICLRAWKGCSMFEHGLMYKGPHKKENQP